MEFLRTKQGLFKRFTSLILTVCCMLSMFPAASAANKKRGHTHPVGWYVLVSYQAQMV